ncbi:hypothetical protein SAMN04488577_1042 [Bacillus sp. cl95]|nr:hypothetical protein SAMN02799634_101767 [Bacillus sp. UNCCL13]SFQ68489.1 hypothetical protein SAMN04488577_1042 [Bacillus sp. cl95]
MIVAFLMGYSSRILCGFGALFEKFLNQKVKIQKPIFTFACESIKVYEKSLRERKTILDLVKLFSI